MTAERVEVEVVPNPIDDEDFEDEVSELVTRGAADVLERLTVAIRNGHRPIRALRLLNVYSLGIMDMVQELGAEPDEKNYSVGPRTRRAARRAGFDLDMGEDGIANGRAPIGGQVNAVLSQFEPVLSEQRDYHRTGKISNLLTAIETAVRLNEKKLETQLRAELAIEVGVFAPDPNPSTPSAE